MKANVMTLFTMFSSCRWRTLCLSMFFSSAVAYELTLKLSDRSELKSSFYKKWKRILLETDRYPDRQTDADYANLWT